MSNNTSCPLMVRYFLNFEFLLPQHCFFDVATVHVLKCPKQGMESRTIDIISRVFRVNLSRNS
jgi:hypothetical protein